MSKNDSWDIAIGLAKLSGGAPSEEFLEMVDRENRSEITTDDMRAHIIEKHTKNIPDDKAYA